MLLVRQGSDPSLALIIFMPSQLGRILSYLIEFDLFSLTCQLHSPLTYGTVLRISVKESNKFIYPLINNNIIPCIIFI